jgi:glycosyltransferase involved in cell wall biosynthesis
VSPTLSFIIPVRNDAERLGRCLASIAALTPTVPHEIIVADNGSTDDSPRVAEAAGARVVRLPSRPVSVMRNEAAATATGEFLAFVDADHELARGWMEGAMNALAPKEVWAAGANYHAPSDGTWVQRMYDRFRDHVTGTRPVEWLPSGNLVVRRGAFEAVAGFDSALESCEDVDFCRRLRLAGGLLVESDVIRSVHLGDPRTLKGLFFAELWRGRDNLRVSLRERLTLRSAPSIVIPILHLLALATAVVGAVVALRTGGVAWLASALTLSAALTTLRALRLASRAPAGTALAEAPRAWIVAAVYDAARALALVVRVGHQVRRKG